MAPTSPRRSSTDFCPPYQLRTRSSWTKSEPKRYGLHAPYQAGPLWSLFEEVLLLWEHLAERQIEFESADRWISFTARNS